MNHQRRSGGRMYVSMYLPLIYDDLLKVRMNE